MSHLILDKEHVIIKIFFFLFVLSYVFPISDVIISHHKFSEHSVDFSYTLNYFRLSVTLLAIIYFKELFRGVIFIKPLFLTALLLLFMGLLLPKSIIAFELSYFDVEFFYWMLLQLNTVIAEGIIFFILIPKILKYNNLAVIATIFALAHGVNTFLPLIFVVGLFYAWVLKRYNFITHITVHFLFNFLHLLLFTYPKAL